MALDDVARRFLQEVLKNGKSKYGVKFSENGREFRVIVEEDTTIRKDMNEGIEKNAGRISAGPAGGVCACCGGSGRG